MEIVIENPAESTPSPSVATATSPSLLMHPSLHRFHGHYGAEGSAGTVISGTDYYTRPRSRPPLPMSADLDGAATTTMRRVDRSGLLEIPEMEPARCRPRLLTGAENVAGHVGTLSRRIDRSGLLEAVPEVPDTQKSPEMSSRTPEEESHGRSIADRQLTGAETVDERGPSSLSPKASKSPSDLTLGRGRSQGSLEEIDPRRLVSESRTITGSPQSIHSGSTRPSPSSPNPYFRLKGSPNPMTSLRTSPLIGGCAEGDTRNRAQFCHASKFVPIEPHPAYTHANPPVVTERQYSGTCVSSPPTVSTKSCSAEPSSEQTTISNETVTSKDKKDCLGRLSPAARLDRRSPMTLSNVPDVIEAHGSSVQVQTDHSNVDTPEGERAEAEGCEHTAVDSVEEARVTFKAPNKLLHNENVQTLRVIILSEQL